MQPIEIAREILDTMLGYLGFVVKVELDEACPDGGLQVITHEPKPLIGRQGERLEEIQYLVNRLLQVRVPDAPRIRVDVDHYRAQQEQRLIEEAEYLAERVLATGQPAKLPPMNSWFRRVIHHHFANHPKVKTWSPDDSARVKCVTLIPKS
ncbi:MAG: single-stranded DNA-binding protein [Verrucomicrobiae bacterium]|nr:single-stranded DNA-binding protein [Verrucomicrobiae bacterium]